MFDLFKKNKLSRNRVPELAYLCIASYESLLSSLESDLEKFRKKSRNCQLPSRVNKESLFAFSFVLIAVLYRELAQDKNTETTLGDTLKYIFNEDWWRIKDLNTYEIAMNLDFIYNEHYFESIKNYLKDPKIDAPFLNNFIKGVLKRRGKIPRVLIDRSLNAHISTAKYFLHYRALQS